MQHGQSLSVCVSWDLTQEISVAAWDKIASDFRKVAAAFPAWVDERRREENTRAPSFGRTVFSLLGLRYGRYPRPGVAPFVWGNGGEGFSLESVEVCPSPDDAPGRDTAPWSFSRRAVAGFARPNGAVHGDLLLCLLAVVQDHVPGVLTINQNDYALGRGEPGPIAALVESFVGAVLGRSVHLPPQEGRAPIPGPASPLGPAPLFAGPLSVDQGGILPTEEPSSEAPSEGTPEPAVPAQRSRGP